MRTYGASARVAHQDLRKLIHWSGYGGDADSGQNLRLASWDDRDSGLSGESMKAGKEVAFFQIRFPSSLMGNDVVPSGCCILAIVTSEGLKCKFLHDIKFSCV